MFKWILAKLRKTFIAGLLVTLPIVITVYFSVFLFNALDRLLGPSVTELLIKAGAPLPHTYRIPGLGLSLTILIVIFTGIVATNFMGKKLVSLGESIVFKIPVFRSIYSGVKQIIETVASANTAAFTKVVMFEFPRNGIYTIGLISSEAKGEPQNLITEDVINVFIPTVPNITTGFFLMIPRKDLTMLSMSVEDGIKMMMSGGILMPKVGNESQEKEE